jgi:alkanesulfonate monooxygenase SsuD/methylene tetrahydromethanopterin reductase-like flavin-dependent oxidoreductase (luciferase family)
MNTQFKLAWHGDVGRNDLPLSIAVDRYAEQLRMIARSAVDFAILGSGHSRGFNRRVVASALAPRVDGIGLVPSLSIADYPPYKLARLMASLDNVTYGRAGWDIAALDDQSSGDGKFEMPSEYVDVCRKLWNSWAPGALVEDTDTAVFADPTKVRPVNHAGTFFKVRGPLNTIPSCGAPLLVHTPQNQDELEFAGRHADVAVIQLPTIPAISRTCDRIRTVARDAGRPDGALQTYMSIHIEVDEAQNTVTTTESATGGITLLGPSEDIATLLAETVADTGCDGVLVHGRWDPVHTTIICTQVLGTLRRRGHIRQRSNEITGLRDKVTAQPVPVPAG